MFFPDYPQKRILLPMNLHNLGIRWNFVLSFRILFGECSQNFGRILAESLQNARKMLFLRSVFHGSVTEKF